MLENICNVSQSHPNVNSIESHYKLRNSINQRKQELKGALKATQNMDNGLHKVFKTVIKDILQVIPLLGIFGLEVFHFIIKQRNFAEVTKLSDDIK